MRVLEVHNATKCFGKLVAVNDVSLLLEADQVHGVIGPNGSGKTTMLNLISGALPLDAGTVRLADVDVTGFSLHRVAAHGIARTFQEIQLFWSMTLLDNVLLGGYRLDAPSRLRLFSRRRTAVANVPEADVRAQEALEFVGLADRRFELARNISYGNQRLLELARAIAGRPRVLLLDEPAAGLSQGEANDLMVLIDKIRNLGCSVLLVEHNMNLVMGICDTISVLDYGTKIAHGSPDEVSNSEAVIQAYLGVPLDAPDATMGDGNLGVNK